jgi:hypothetical protein
MSADSVLEPMRLIQGDGQKFLVPLLLQFLFGGWVFASGLLREGHVSQWPLRVLAVAFCSQRPRADTWSGLARVGMRSCSASSG